MEPCKQEENITKLFEFHDKKMEQLQNMEVRQVEIQGDIKHIKTRIDNGMSHTLSNLAETFAKLEPVIAHHASIVKRIEDIGWWISKGLLLALIGVLAWAVANGWKP